MNPSATLGDLYDAIDAFAPFAAARPSDNCGIVAGSRSKPLHRVLLALDVTPDVVQEPVSVGADLYPHPRTTMDENAEFITRRPLKVRFLRKVEITKERDV